jgi:membrane fusion protein (multidrug efflux system)
MTRRTGLVLMIVTGVVFGLGAVKVLQIQAAIAQAASFQPPPEAVTTIEARSERWPTTLAAVGTVRAVRGVTLSADLPGVVETLAFDSGRPVREGELLVRLDARQERAQLAAAEAQRELARVNLERVRGLVAQGIVAQAELDRVSAEHKQAEARVGEIQATIERKQIRAPFSGVLGIRQVDLGQYLNAGDPIVPLQALDPIYVNFSVPQQQVGEVRVGREVRVSVSGIDGGEMAGRISAVDSVVDAATRNVQVQATLANPKGELHPGMFVEARVVTGEGTQALVLPASAISYAPYGDSVFVVSAADAKNVEAGKVVTQQFVKLGGTRGDQVAVLSGLEAGAEVVSSGAFKLRSGAAVRVNNEVQPANDPRPRPEDN